MMTPDETYYRSVCEYAKAHPELSEHEVWEHVCNTEFGDAYCDRTPGTAWKVYFPGKSAPRDDDGLAAAINKFWRERE